MSKFIELNTVHHGKTILNTDSIKSVYSENFTCDNKLKCNARIVLHSSGPVISSDLYVTETYEQLKEMLEVK